MNPLRKLAFGGAMAGTALLGGALGTSLIGTANAQTTDSTQTTTASSSGSSGATSSTATPPPDAHGAVCAQQRAFARDRSTVLDAHGLGGGGEPEGQACAQAGCVVQRGVVGVDRALLVLWQR